MPFLIIRNDITKVHADAIVNTANEDLLEGSGTSKSIYVAAGEEQLNKACAEIGHCDLGKAVITPAFHLDAKYIIHAVGPIWDDGYSNEEQTLYSAYMESMKLAAEYQCESIAFPLISSGNYGYPKNQAMKVAISAISDFLMEHEMLVYMVLYDSESLAISQKLFASIEEYIDDNYVDENDSIMAMPRNRFTMPCAPMPQAFPGKSLDSIMDHLEETFSQMLLRLIDERGFKDSAVYKKANVDRRHFSKIRNDVDYAPAKKTVIAFAIALELSLDETLDLLKSAGFTFSNSSKFDVIMCYFIENENYDLFEINEVLFTYGLPLLGE